MMVSELQPGFVPIVMTDAKIWVRQGRIELKLAYLRVVVSPDFNVTTRQPNTVSIDTGTRTLITC